MGHHDSTAVTVTSVGTPARRSLTDRLLRLFVRIANTPRFLVTAVLLDWLVCSGVYSLLEGKGPIEGLWWGIVTGSTVGYGDFYPDSTLGRLVGAVLIVTMLMLSAMAISQLSAELIVDRDAFTHEEQLVARQVDDDTNRLAKENNALLRATLVALRGEDHLDDVLDQHRRTEQETIS